MAEYDHPSTHCIPVGAFYSVEGIAELIERPADDVAKAIETIRLPVQLLLDGKQYFAHQQIVRIRAQLDRTDSGIAPTKMKFQPALQRN
jgi:hypothetical protein